MQTIVIAGLYHHLAHSVARLASALTCLLLLLFLWPSLVLAQESAAGDHVRIRWLAPDAFARGQTETIGFYFEVDPHWHVYWRNAGDSGAAPRFAVQVLGAEIGAIQWPFPARLPIAHLTNLGYEGNVAYLLPVTPTAGTDNLSLTVDLEWLVCKVDCIPGFARMSLARPVAEQADWRTDDLALRDRFLARVPQTATGSPWTALNLEPVDVTHLRLTLDSESGPAPLPQIFPLSGDLLTAAEPEIRAIEGTDHADELLSVTFQRLPGAILPDTTGFVISDGQQAWRLDQVPIRLSAGSAAVSASSEPLWWLLLAAFVGGMILNLMPCVFPVLSIKLFGLVQSPAAQRWHGALAYSAGVLVTFAALGGLLLGLRATGNAIGWGFQLQSAPVILALIALFWLMALSFSGVYEFGHRLMSLAGNNRGGAFVTGILAVFVATPCTGPFMGVALGAATVLPAASALVVFLGMGAGLAAPIALVSVCPPLLRRLPKPGPWMDGLRQLLAFPLYATVIWLLWVLGRLIGDSGWLVGSLLMLALVFAIWLGRSGKRYSPVAAASVALVALVLAFSSLRTSHGTATESAANGPWQAFDPVLLAQARAADRPVFIDYTAAWCITCQVNKALVLDTEPVLDFFERNNVLLIRADWTRSDPAITDSLARLGRNSVPVYAWYPAGAKKAELLPQILQSGIIYALF